MTGSDLMECTECGEHATTASYRSVVDVPIRGESTFCFNAERGVVFLHEELWGDD